MQAGEDSVRTAVHTLELFASVGASAFDLTLTNETGEKVRFRRALTLDYLRYAMPEALPQALRQHLNVIIRPHSPPCFIQLDDLAADRAHQLAGVAFMTLQTSPGNFQAWLAMAGPPDQDFARRLRKGAGADATASGATRIAGSLNFKIKYAPAYPRIAITHAAPAQMATRAQLEGLGVVALPETVRPHPRASQRASQSRRQWPSYERCLDAAPPNHGDTGPDISRADFTWCLTAIDWGHSVEATAAALMEHSSKAQQNGERYAGLTANNAAAAIRQRRNRP